MTPFNTLDIVFFFTTLIIVLVACYRGAVKEIFSLINWIIAFALSYLISPFLAKAIAGYFDSRLMVDVVTRIIIFITSFVLFTLLTANFVRDLSDSMNIYLNRFLGLCFGFLKSLLIFGLLFSLYNCFFDYALGKRLVKKDSTKSLTWFENANSSGLIRFSGEILDPIVRGFIGILKINFSDVLEIQNSVKYPSELEEKNQIETPNELQKKEKIDNPQQKNDLGYDKKDIEKMQKLIEIINQ